MNPTLSLPLAVVVCVPASAQKTSPLFELTVTWGRIEESSHGRHEDERFRQALRPRAARVTQSHEWATFAALLPEEAEMGEVYRLGYSKLRPFLRQMHARPVPRPASRVPDRVSRPGIRAVVLEKSAERIDLLIRAHVSFELERKKIFLIPAQLEGRLVVDPSAKKVIGFRLALPKRTYNYEIHIHQPDRTLIDIGRLSELRLAGGSLPAGDEKLAEARKKLRRAFYRFEQVTWLSLERGLEQATASKKPLHLITIFGQLDDESC